MSSMLEQAIVDATALKEAAIKNAEQALIERYSVDIKDAVGLMLEQPEMGGAAPSGLDAAPPAHGDGERLFPCPEDMEPVTLDFEELRVAMDAAEEAGEEVESAPAAEESGMSTRTTKAQEQRPGTISAEASRKSVLRKTERKTESPSPSGVRLEGRSLGTTLSRASRSKKQKQNDPKRY